MAISEARIDTERPHRYLAQICQHAAAMGGGRHQARMHGSGEQSAHQPDVRAEWSDDEGTVAFTPGGTCTLRADGATLTMRIDADDEASLRRIQAALTRDLARFGRRDGLTVTWQDSGG